MGYQALLFCPDEKLTRIVAQVFSELDFNVEPVHEPFSAVKKLMAQRYDALVIDCESESNASLLFKSARNSSSNQGALAIAIVEGQAGVAKAYRIGANLVLTKPINVDQTKGTLRVARGLLRKGADAASAASGGPASTAISPSGAAVSPTSGSTALETGEKTVAPDVSPDVPMSPAAAPPEPSEVTYGSPEFEAGHPAAAASVSATQTALPSQEAPTKSAAVAETPVPAPVPVPKEPAQSVPTVAALGTRAQAAAAAPAKAKAKIKQVPPGTMGQAPEFEPVDHVHNVTTFHDSASDVAPPAFAALQSKGSGGAGSKKMLLGAVALLTLAALGYFGWRTLGQHKPATPEPASAPQPSEPTSAAPVSLSPRVDSVPATGASSSTLMETSKVIAAAEPEKPSGSLILHLESTPSLPDKSSKTAPIVVKPGKRSRDRDRRAAVEETAAPEPGSLAVASPDEDVLSSVVTTAAAAPRHPTLTTVKISQGVSQGLLIKKVNPIYPPSAKSMRLEGVVQLEATIDREGRVVNPVVLKGDKVLARAALDAVRQWRYKPYYLDKQPVEIQTQITINFKLPN